MRSVQVFLLVILPCFTVSIIIIPENDYKRLPSIYELEDFDECREKSHVFCRVGLTLKPTDTGENNHLWDIIQKCKKDSYHISHEMVYRGICVSNYLYENKDELTRRILTRENAKLKDVSLKANVNYFRCKKFDIKPNLYDYFSLCLQIVFLLLIIYATIADFRSSKEKSNKYLMALSILKNWEIVKKPISNPDYERLKVFEGIRTYNMCLVIMGHVLIGFTSSFISNTSFLEQLSSNIVVMWFILMASFLVQINFMFSSWLLTQHMYKALEDQKKITLADVLKALLFRYLRLAPTLVISIIFFESTQWARIFISSPNTDLVESNYEACQKNWWATVLLIQNFLYPIDMCNMGMWYLANEFQLFAIGLLAHYLIFKFSLNKVHVFGFMLLVPCLKQGYEIFNNNLDVVFRFTAESIKLENILTSYEYHILYFSLFANMGSSVIGLIFGNIYYMYKNTNFNINWVFRVVWILGFFVTPYLVTKLAELQYSTIISTLLGPILKPLFSAGIAIGVFGMAFGIGGPIKEFCEMKLVVFVAKWNYCTYIFHFIILFLRLYRRRTLIEFTAGGLIEACAVDIILSFLIGLVMHLLIELPMKNIIDIVLGIGKKYDKSKSN